jgi:hypothetical protein
MISFFQNTLLPIVWESLIPVAVTAVIGLCIRIVAVWFFRRTDSAIMKERINKGDPLLGHANKNRISELQLSRAVSSE